MALAANGQHAKRIVKSRRFEMKDGEPNKNEAVPISVVDRRCEYPRSTLGIIIDRDFADQYSIAIKAGFLKGKYFRDDFDPWHQRLL